jgi:tRNA pseudouridine32 synthase / 23S rRNA pseudouridine746 synthase
LSPSLVSHKLIKPLRPFTYMPPSGDVEVLCEDAQFLIINKPAGILSVPGKSGDLKDCLESRVKAVFPDARTIHRLDTATSGIMVMARTAHAHRHIGLQFENRQVSKTYIADIWGVPNEKSGTINLPLICDWPNRPLQKVDVKNGKPAETEWEILEAEDNISRVLLKPKTGRSHQLRVHMLELGHPILGDNLYAHDDAFNTANRMHLHASTLNFRHPDGGAHLEFTADCPF